MKETLPEYHSAFLLPWLTANTKNTQKNLFIFGFCNLDNQEVNLALEKKKSR